MFKDKNTLIGLLLIFGILIVFSIVNSPSKEEKERIQREQDSLRSIAQQKEKLAEESVPVSEAISQQETHQKDDEPIAVQVSPSVSATDPMPEVKTPFSVLPEHELNIYYIENDLLRVGISDIGGKITSVQLKEYLKYDKTPLMLFDDNIQNFGLNFFYQNKPVFTEQLLFHPETDITGETFATISGSPDSLEFVMRLYPVQPDSNEIAEEWIEFRYSLVNGSYVIGFDIVFHNMKNYIPESVSYVNFDLNAVLSQQEKSLSNEQAVTTIYYSFMDGEVDYLSERKDDAKSLQTKFRWVSFKQQFFSFALISETGFQAAEIAVQSIDDPEHPEILKALKSSISIPYEQQATYIFPVQIYAGPNKFNLLRKMNLDLERQIPLGWSFFLMQWINRYAVIPVFNFLEKFNMNYGIIILILTILLKIVLFPVAYKTYLSSAKMRVLKPDIEEIGKKYPKKEDAMKKQQATMELYKKAGVNPMSGCIPMLLQFPILIAMFRFFPASIELRQEAFLWADDLSSYDSILELGFNIPFYGSHVSLFTLLMTVSTIIYTRINSKMMAGSNQMPGMKTMMYLMPVMFLGFFNSYSSALSYYYFLANMITFGQMAIFNKMVNEKAIHEKIAANKKKPVKKSGFQKRLEEMSKMQQNRKK
jgi:YidC/Oxa1 family membrane protein insertase